MRKFLFAMFLGAMLIKAASSPRLVPPPPEAAIAASSAPRSHVRRPRARAKVPKYVEPAWIKNPPHAQTPAWMLPRPGELRAAQ